MGVTNPKPQVRVCIPIVSHSEHPPRAREALPFFTNEVNMLKKILHYLTLGLLFYPLPSCPVCQRCEREASD